VHRAGQCTVPVSAPMLFTGNDCLAIGNALGSSVSLDYHKKVPFNFNGKIEQVHVKYALAKPMQKTVETHKGHA